MDEDITHQAHETFIKSERIRERRTNKQESELMMGTLDHLPNHPVLHQSSSSSISNFNLYKRRSVPSLIHLRKKQRNNYYRFQRNIKSVQSSSPPHCSNSENEDAIDDDEDEDHDEDEDEDEKVGIERRIMALQRLVPGGGQSLQIGNDDIDIDKLFEETASYILALQSQVKTMKLLTCLFQDTIDKDMRKLGG